MTHTTPAARKNRLHKRAGRALQKHGRFVLHVTRRMLAHSAEIAVALAVLSVVAQFAWPRDRALPLTRMGGSMVGGDTRQEVERKLEETARTAAITLKTPSKEWLVNPRDIGVGIRSDTTAELAVRYEWWERVLPFSAVVRAMQSAGTAPLTVIDDERMQAFAAKLVAEDAAAAHDAAIAIKDGRVTIDPSKDGYKFTAESVRRQLSAVPLDSGQPFELRPERVAPKHDTQSLRRAAAQAQAMLDKNLELRVAGKTFTPGRAQIGEWLAFAEDPATGQMAAVIQDDKIRAYLETVNKQIAIGPGTVTVTLLDGQEVARTTAAPGRSVAVDATIQQIRQHLQAAPATATLDLPVADVPPNVVYNRTYSSANSGLQAIITDWERETYGDYGVIVREIGGQNRYAEWQPDKRFVPSSTYKMFLAYVIFTKIARGEISFGQTTDIGWTVKDCIDEMIHHSTNPCAISLQNLAGWQTTDDMLHQAGFTGTMLNNQNGGEKHTTVREEANFLLRLQSGTLMNAEHTAYLLDLFKHQVWRGGIPSGVPRGVVVADKVGFYNGYVHDVAIVYSPKATYILAIMSKGGSDPAFADLSRRVYAFFND